MKTINSLRSKLLALTLALMASVSTFAYEFEYVNDFHIDGFGYKIISVNTPDDGEGFVSLIEIADCKKDVVIPKYVSYGDRGFHVTTFGMGSVVFTNDASSVVESITIPKTTNIINKNVLAGCPNLKTVVIDSENPYYDSRENCNAIITTSQNPYFTPNTLIAGCKTTIIPNSVVEIGDNAFYNCESLDIITIPRSVTKIGNSAFNACSSLSSIILSENLTAIGDWAFDNCNNLKEVVCYATQPPTISRYTFLGISPTIYVPVESIELYRKTNIWKDFQIMRIEWSEECYEYRDYNLTIQLFPRKSSLVYLLYNTIDRTIEPPYVDSVWILDPELDKQNPLHVHTSYAQPGDTIDLSFLEKNKSYILKVYINECQMSRVFLHRVVKWEYKWCNQWNVLWFDGTRFEETAKTSHYQLGQDTVIGDYTYRKFTSQTSVRFTEDWKVYVYYEGFDDNDPYTPDLPTGEYLAYDFSAQVGDTLEVFSGIGTYSTYLCVVDDVQQTDIQTALRTITLHKICRKDTDGDGIEEDYDDREMTWIEGVGSPEGFLISDLPCGLVGGGTFALLCAYKGDELKYTGSLYDEYGCEYNATEQKPEDLFPTLWGLQRTSCDEWFDGCEENKSYLFSPKEITEINGKQYLKCGGVFLREEDSKVLIYSFPYEKDLVLYDYTLEVGDTLQNLGIDIYSFPELEYAAVVDYIAYEDYDVETDEFIIKKEPLGSKRVTEVSTITLLDGKEYKRWLFGNDWENGNYYVEGIGNVGGSFGGDYINIANPYALPTCYMGEHLVCASRNGKLLYQMDPVKMDELGAECLCDYDSGPRKDNAKDGQIGGRPTPTQWNQLELDLREMENGTTILRAETFSYTLENDSIVANDKIFYQLARQSTKDTATTKSFVGALHFGKDEDNRVYFLRDGVEYVLYDFTAEPGDTIEIFAGINNYPQETTYTHVVTGKDTLENGACRMLLEVVFPEGTMTAENAEKVWLAGLGSVDGIVHNAAKRTSNAHAAPSRSADSNETESSVMLCAWREDSCLYTTNHPDYETFGCVYNQDPTSVEDISTSQSSYQKIIREGQFLILHNGKTYSVMGIEL